MHEIIESEMHIDIDGKTVITTKSVLEEGHDVKRGTVLVG
jgi:transcriptional regulatory protein LevR